MDGAEGPPHEAVVEILAEEWAELGRLGSGLDASLWGRPTLCPGWSVADIYAHVAGTEHFLLGDPILPPLTEDPEYVHNPLGSWNEAWVVAFRGRGQADVLADFAEVTDRRLAQLRAMDAAAFDAVGPSPVGEVPYREFMEVRVMDCWVHEQDVRQAVGLEARLVGPAAELALGRFERTMPYVVARRAKAPEGSLVRLEVRRPQGPTLLVSVAVRDGRGVAVAAEAAASATLNLDAATWMRLCCGRVSAEQARTSGKVEVAGDTALAGRVLGAMAFMI